MFTRVTHWFGLLAAALVASAVLTLTAYSLAPAGGAWAENAVFLAALLTVFGSVVAAKGAWRTFITSWDEGVRERKRMQLREQRYGFSRGGL